MAFEQKKKNPTASHQPGKPGMTPGKPGTTTGKPGQMPQKPAGPSKPGAPKR